MPTITTLDALEILDSRGRPTIECTCVLSSGTRASASVPSGASTGRAEALELRDGDPAYFRGLGCRKAAANINETIHTALAGKSFASQNDLDAALIDLDGTPDKSRLGANALLAVSLAFARASALEHDIALYRYFAAMLGQEPRYLPLPMINLFSGGKHAGKQVAIQDIQVMQASARSMRDVLARTFEIFYSAADWLAQHDGMRLLTADEGGLAPAVANVAALFDLSVQAIRAAGLAAPDDVVLTVDVAASHFFADGVYRLDDEPLTSAAMVDQLLAWCRQYPIASVEDGLAEEDWAGWQRFTGQSDALVLGDDLLCTNPSRIEKASRLKACNALLLKVNQIGTLSEACRAYMLAAGQGWRVVVSARSGETEDNWLADLAVGWSAQHIKVGAITQSERLAKYNRLLAIERETALPLFEL
jgi:enolase